MFFAKYRDKLREGSRRNAARHELNRQLFNVELGVDEMRREAKRYQAMRLKAGTMCRKCVQDANLALARNQASRVLKLSNRAERYMELSERLSLIACEVKDAMARKEVPKMIATLMDGLDKAVRTNDIDMVAQMVTKTEWAIKHLKKKETESLNTEEEDCVEESENGEVEDEIEEDDSSEDDDEESVLTLCEVTDEQVDNYLANVIRDVRGRHLRTSPTYP